MRKKTKRKLDKVKELLKCGYTLRKAIKEVRVGWKTYYKYEDYVLNDPNVPRPKRIERVRVGPFYVDRVVVRVLRDVAKEVAMKSIVRKYRTIYINGKMDEVRKLKEFLLKKWLQEIILPGIY